jgi:hypothetical protein
MLFGVATVASCGKDKVQKTINPVLAIPLSELTCDQALEAFSLCDKRFAVINHVRSCRERYHPVLWKCAHALTVEVYEEEVVL